MPAEGALFSVLFEVPGDPRGKGRPRVAVFAGRAQVYTDKKTRTEESVIRFMAHEAMAGLKPFDGPIVLRLCAYRRIPESLSKLKRAAAIRGDLVPTTKPDIDNYTKMIDALNGIVWRDDSLIVTAVIHKRYAEEPRLVVDVRSAATADLPSQASMRLPGARVAEVAA